MRFFYFLLLLFLSSSGFSQNLHGKITGKDSLAIPGVYLFNPRTNTHANTDETGVFILKNCNPGDSIKITSAGYQTLILPFKASYIELQLSVSAFQLDEVVVSEGLNHLSSVSAVDLNINPVNSSQELLRKVPGLFIGQHAGGGKAEQLFLRGFDLDHGTDINISVDGMPVNMISHAHGQGYADLHFLIPETVAEIDFDKGPYHADKGNMATAGYVAFKTKDRLENSSITAEGGKFNTLKLLGLFNLINRPDKAMYFAADYLSTDGYFTAPQAFHRINLMGKYTGNFSKSDKFSVSASTFGSKWNASGQIPQRSIDNGLITRFGAIDQNEGGETSRSNLNILYTKYFNANTWLSNSAFYNRYKFELYSNFTFYLNDPVNGDQIRQKEDRNITGMESILHKRYFLSDMEISLQAGAGVRYDDVNNIELSRTLNRNTTLQNTMLGNIRETNAYSFLNTELEAGKLIINPSLRADYLHFNYADQLEQSKSPQGKAIISPKLNFLFNQSRDLQFFLKLGKGFHSNDARVVVAQQGYKILPSAYGADLGTSWKPTPRLILNSALWYLYLKQEFVYVGDEAVIEPGGRTVRKGIDLGVRYQLTDWLFLNSDMTYTHARALDEARESNFIPLAPKFTFTGGLSVKQMGKFSGSLRSRYLASRPANEDNSIVAKGYTITDANLNYTLKRLILNIAAENIFNRQWNETQFATVSRLRSEVQSVEEIHLTPGTPFSMRIGFSYKL